MNQITVNFIECDPAPASGYNIQWRVAGTADPFTDAGNFLSSPAIFFDNTNPDGTQYEGFIRSDCSESGSSGTNFGNEIPWSTSESGGGGLGVAVGARYNNSLGTHCSLPTNTVYTDDGTITSGKTVYQDINMTILLDGFDFISEAAVGTIYEIDSVTAVVGANTGNSC